MNNLKRYRSHAKVAKKLGQNTISFAKASFGALLSKAAASSSSSMREGPSGAVTSQLDSKLLYKRKRAPKKVRRKAAKKYKKFLFLQLKGKSDNTNLFTYFANGGASSSASQLMHSVTIGYSWCGSAAGNDQVGNMWQALQNYENTDPINVSKNWYLTGLSADYTLANVSGDGATAEVDVYEFVFRKDLEYENNPPCVSQLLTTELAKEEKMPGATSSLATTNLGYVPTDSNTAMKYIIILSKQRFYLPDNTATSFTKRIRFKKPVKYIGQDFELSDNAANANLLKAKKGITRGIIIIYRGLPGAATAAGPVTIAINAQARYRFKVLSPEENQNAIGT